jgi:hypothetical protein
MIHTVRFEATAPVTARYLRVIVQNYGCCRWPRGAASRPTFY